MNPNSKNLWPLIALALCPAIGLVPKVEAGFTPPPLKVPEGF
jgi:hypothetical protein